MPRKPSTPATPAPANRVWIELEKPRNAAHGQQVAELANNMLRRLRGPVGPDTWETVFEWDDTRKVFLYGGPMGWTTLTDRGQWFNLDFLGRAK